MSDLPHPTPASASPEHDTMMSSNARANVVLSLFGVGLLLDIAMLVSDFLERGLILQIQRGVNVPESQTAAFDAIAGIVGIAAVVVHVLTIVFFLMWIYRTHLNLRAFTSNTLNFRSGWAVGWWFVPFANLVQGVRVVNELWRWSDPRHGEKFATVGPTVLLTFWWAAFLISNAIGRVALRKSWRAETVAELLDANLWSMISGAANVISVPLAFLVVLNVSRAHRRRLASLGYGR